MAGASVTCEMSHIGSPGPSKGLSPGSGGTCSMDAGGTEGEKSFTALQGLIMAEDRRTKEKEMSLQNLMEYREAPASPSASSVTTTLSLENCGSPSTPNSPPPENTEMDADRLPNELLDELCEDIGMKEGMGDLDFVEFLMEQDTVDPHQYMTDEALRSSGFPTPTNQSQANSKLNTPTNNRTSHDHGWGNRTCGSPSYSIASSTNVTVATSSGSSSPVSKRFHLSTSGPPSPPALTHMGGNHVFKQPQTPPTPRRPLPNSQGAVSPRSNLSVTSNQSNHSDHSSHSNNSSVHSNQSNNQNVPQRCYSPRTLAGGVNSTQLPHSTTNNTTFNKPPPQYGQFQGQNLQKTPTNQPYQRHGRPVPPNVNVQNFQPQNNNNKFMSPTMPQSQGQLNNNTNNQSCAMNNPNNLGGTMNIQGQNTNSQFNRPLESPLDQGYYTASDTLSTRSIESGGSTTVPISVQNSMHSQNKVPMGSGTPQKSVHFSENMSASNNYGRQTEGLPYEPCYRTNVPDCELEEYRNSIQKMQSKMMPRLNHHVKPETAPYTVPSNNGQPGINPYDYSQNTPNGANMSNMQQFDFPGKSSSNNFGMDNNQNLVMNYNENMTSMNCQMPPSCNGPAGNMQQQQQMPMHPYNRGQSQCQMGQDPSKGQGQASMYDPMNIQNNMMKNNSQHLNDSNCQFGGQTQGKMNDNCGIMGMNQGIMGSHNGGQMSHGQDGVNPNFNGAQNFQGMHQEGNAQTGYQGQGQRPQLNMDMSSSANANNGMMGFDPTFEQNNMSAAMSGNANMSNMDNGHNMFSQNGMGGWTEGMAGSRTQQPHHMGATPQSAPMNIPGQQQGMPGMTPQGQCGQLSGVPCVIPNCTNCKSGSPNKPPMMASQQRFIQHLITDRSNAFRSHPLFPLLRDLIIADMNFSTPNFPYQLISNLPADFDKLLQNFLHRNPPAGSYQTNIAVESVVMDALKYAHQCLIEKIRQKQDQDVDKHSKSTSKSLSAIEEFCEKFDQSVRKSYIKPATLQLGGNQGMGEPNPQMGNMGPPDMTTPTKDLKYGMGMNNFMMPGGMFMSPQAKKGLEFGNMMSPGFKPLSDFDSASDCGSIVSSSSHGKPESKKHPSLPKEAVAIMLDWLRQHKDNPYPNDDEKAMLIKQTGLTINQINYWFTNARRRILPKWAQQCKT